MSDQRTPEAKGIVQKVKRALYAGDGGPTSDIARLVAYAERLEDAIGEMVDHHPVLEEGGPRTDSATPSDLERARAWWRMWRATPLAECRDTDSDRMLAELIGEIRRAERDACEKIALSHEEWANDPGRLTEEERRLIVGTTQVIAMEIRSRGARSETPRAAMSALDQAHAFVSTINDHRDPESATRALAKIIQAAQLEQPKARSTCESPVRCGWCNTCVDAEIRAAGGDPVAIGKWGVKLVEELKSKREAASDSEGEGT